MNNDCNKSALPTYLIQDFRIEWLNNTVLPVNTTSNSNNIIITTNLYT